MDLLLQTNEPCRTATILSLLVDNGVSLENGVGVIRVLCKNATIISKEVKDLAVKLTSVKPEELAALIEEIGGYQDDLFVKHKEEILDSIKNLN
jgi:hypothetical protein